MIPVLFALWLLLCGLFLGSLFRRLGFPWRHRGEEIFFSGACALGAMSLATLGLGQAGLARPPFLYAAAAATGAAAAVTAWAARGRPAPAPIPRPRAFALCAAPLLLAPLTLLPPFFYDTLRYHYGLPSLFLRSGSTRPISWFVESHFPLGVEMISMIGMVGGSYRGANATNLVYLALCGAGILSLADRLGSRRAGWVAAPLFLFSATAVHTVFLQKNDLGVTLFFFGFAYAFLAYLEGDGDRRFLLLSAALCGAALGSKYTMAVFLGAVFLAGAARRALGRPAAALARTAGDAVLFLAVAAAVDLPWLLRNFAATGNPVYPLLNGVFDAPTWSPGRARLLAGDAHSFAAQFHSWKDSARLLLSVTFVPDTNVSGLGASIGAGFLGAIAYPVVRRRPPAGWAFLRDAALVTLVAWFFSSWFSRFLLPALPMMALLAGSLVDGVAEKAGRRGDALAAALVGAALLAQAASAVAPAEFTHIGNAWKASVRLIGHRERAGALAAAFSPSFPAAQFANKELPDSAKIMMVGETLPYYFRRPMTIPSAYDEHPLQTIAPAGRPAAEARAALRGMGFTHVLVNWPEWRRLSQQYYRTLWPEGDRKAVEELVAGLPAIYRDRTVSIHSLEEDGNR